MYYYCPTEENYYCMEGNNSSDGMEKYPLSEKQFSNDINNLNCTHENHRNYQEDTYNVECDNDENERSRLGCMGELLEPKILISKDHNVISGDILAGGNEDDKKRFKSIYQSDYILPENPRAVYIKPLVCTDHSFTNSYIKNAIENHFIKDSNGLTAAILPFEHTEYQEAISKLGGQIIREKIHKPKRDHLSHKFL